MSLSPSAVKTQAEIYLDVLDKSAYPAKYYVLCSAVADELRPIARKFWALGDEVNAEKVEALISALSGQKEVE